jgi:hypothetical protein
VAPSRAPTTSPSFTPSVVPSPAPLNYCGQCSDYNVLLTMTGSFFGVPYGWRGDTHYHVSQRDGEVEYEGVLATGMIREHYYCLTTGTYEISLDDVPADDDGWLDDQYESYAKYVGVQEYELHITDSENSVTINPKTYAVLTVDGSSGTIVVKGDNDDDDATISDGALAGIIIAAVVIIACCIGVVVYLICGSGKKSNSDGDRTQSAVEATASPIQRK